MLKFNFDLDATAEYLTQQSKDICFENGCSEEGHKCESYAYFAYNPEADEIDDLLDVCYPDYFQGIGHPYTALALPLPFDGNGENLKEALELEVNSTA